MNVSIAFFEFLVLKTGIIEEEAQTSDTPQANSTMVVNVQWSLSLSLSF